MPADPYDVPVHDADGLEELGRARGLLDEVGRGGRNPGLAGGSYVGPRGFAEMRGKPTVVTPSRTARDQVLAGKLWDVSEEATKVLFP